MLITPGWRSVQAMAICAGLQPWRDAICASAALRSNRPPCPTGEYAISGMPRSTHHGSRSNSIPRAFRFVKDLVGGGRAVAQFGHVVDVEVGHAPAGDLAGCPQPLERLDRFGEGRAAAPVQQVQVDAVRAQPREAVVAGRFHRPPARVVRENLLTRKTRSRRPAIAIRAPRARTRHWPYISAVSIRVMPRSMPWRSASASCLAERGSSPMCQVPCPSAATGVPSGKRTVLHAAAFSARASSRRKLPPHKPAISASL